MKNFTREYTLFSLCGLNCGLCTMRLGGHCPGCGGGTQLQSCAIARCGMSHGVEFCSECGEYPCERYENMGEYDTFISHLNQLADMDKLKRIGLDAYKIELDERIAILKVLLEHYNDGRRKTMFCMAANLLEIDGLRQVMEQLVHETKSDMTIKEKAVIAAGKLKVAADSNGISLKLRKKP